MTERPGSPAPGAGGAGDSRAERVLSQALRVMAGGGRAATPLPAGDPAGRRRLTTSQLLLLAATFGLLIGIGAGLLALML